MKKFYQTLKLEQIEIGFLKHISINSKNLQEIYDLLKDCENKGNMQIIADIQSKVNQKNIFDLSRFIFEHSEELKQLSYEKIFRSNKINIVELYKKNLKIK